MLRGARIWATILGLVLLLTSLTPAYAAEVTGASLTNDEAVAMLQSYGIVRGDESGNLNLYRNLTRAEAAAIFVRAMNMSTYAGQMASAVPFSDMQGHWAAGEVAMAYQLGLMKGDPDGRFRPNDPITYAEVLTVLLRMIGQEPAGRWDPSVILWRASQVGILPSGVISSAPAVRQQIFWSLASAMTVPLANGRTLLQSFDLTPPGLLVNDVGSPTTAERVTVTGTAVDAYRVLVNSQPATFNRATGAFSAQVDLEMGLNVVEVTAFDLAGNQSSGRLNIERRPKVSRIVIEGPEMVAPNSSTVLEVTAYDADGNEVALENATATLSTNQHSFNLSTRTLKTGDRTGKATLTIAMGDVKGTYTFEVQGPAEDAKSLQIEPVNGGRALAPGKSYTVTVQVINDDGKVASNDYGRKVTLSADGLDDVRISPTTAQTVKGVATFTIRANKEGTIELQAKSSSLDSAEMTLQVLETPRVVLTSSASRLDPEEETVIRARLEDDEGRPVRAKEDITVDLFLDGADGELDGYTLTIYKGEYQSDDRVYFFAGWDDGIARIEGEAYGDRDYPVQALEIRIGSGDGGDSTSSSGPRFVLSASRYPSAGDTVRVTLRILDGNSLRRSGSYAFQIRVSTSNRDDVATAIEVDKTLDVFFDGTAVHPDFNMPRPIYGVKSSSVDGIVVGRTYRGEAEFYVRYDLKGTVTLTAVGVSGTQDAFHPDEGEGRASSGRGITSGTLRLQFR